MIRSFHPFLAGQEPGELPKLWISLTTKARPVSGERSRYTAYQYQYQPYNFGQTYPPGALGAAQRWREPHTSSCWLLWTRSPGSPSFANFMVLFSKIPTKGRHQHSQTWSCWLLSWAVWFSKILCVCWSPAHPSAAIDDSSIIVLTYMDAQLLLRVS